jgi:predicted nucleotidyltransferase
MATIDRSAIQALCDRIVAEFRPERVILFGSHAYGVPRPDSDVDLLVILPFDEQPAYKAIEIVTRAVPRFPVDLLARTPEQVTERLELGDFFMREVMERGKVLYEAPHNGVDREG